MPISIGNTSIETMYVGGTRVTAVYLGSTLLFGTEVNFLITHGDDFIVDHSGNFLIA